MDDLIVIGGGFWGTAIAIKARDAGMSCSVLDEGHPSSGSRNAGALTCLRWYKSDTITKHLPADWTYERIKKWIDWLIQHEHIRHVGQWTYNKNRNTWRRNDDAYITDEVNSILKLAKPRYASVTEIVEHKSYASVFLAGEATRHAKHVVVAAGRWTDRILKASNLKTIGSDGLMGRAMLLKPDPKALRKRCPDWDGEVATVIVRPYKNFDLLPTNNHSWYYGVTTERQESEKAWDELAEAATYLVGAQGTVLHAVRGFRAVCIDGKAKVALVSPKRRVIAVCGGSKVGLGLAGVAADSVMEHLDE